MVRLVAEGLPNKAIAARMGITEGTIKVMMCSAFKALRVSSRMEMAVWFLRGIGTSAELLGERTVILHAPPRSGE